MEDITEDTSLIDERRSEREQKENTEHERQVERRRKSYEKRDRQQKERDREYKENMAKGREPKDAQHNLGLRDEDRGAVGGEEFSLTPTDRSVQRSRDALSQEDSQEETSFTSRLPSVPQDSSKLLEAQNQRKVDAWGILREKYPNANDKKFNVIVGGVSNEVFISLKSRNSLPYRLFKGEDINPNLPKTLQRALGEPAESIVENNDISIDALNETIRQDQEIVDNPETTSEDMQTARDRIQEREAEIERLEGENEVIEERMSLKDRVKAIFKKNGVTILSILTAAGVVIGVIVSSLQKGLTNLAKKIGKPLKDLLKDLLKKLLQLLPQAIGAIVSFLFKTAGEVVEFLGKNIWLLIVGVVIFLIEQTKKR